MRKESVKKVGQAAVVALGAYLAACGPLQSASGWLSDEASSQEAIAQEVEGVAVEFETCAAIDSWQRPSAEEQFKHLEKDTRYGAVSGDLSKATASPFWNQPVVSFTTYGLSARMEPVNLTGLWTVEDEMQNCYTTETTMAINEGDRAETWLLNHQIQSLVKEGDRYLMTVEPAATGMQIIQFERTDELASLPLDVINTNGETVAITTGDWE